MASAWLVRKWEWPECASMKGHAARDWRVPFVHDAYYDARFLWVVSISVRIPGKLEADMLKKS